MRVEQVKENEDGSADYVFDVSEEEKETLIPLGIQLGILLGVTGLTFDQVAKICFDHVESGGEAEK